VNYTEFVQRFPEDKEIGRDITDAELAVYCDNGTDVGIWRQDRRTTCGKGEVLSHADAEMARHWFRTREAARSR
jgi:hypothetical protein